MEHYRQRGIDSLKDGLPTIKFINRINNLIDGMNSQQPSNALKPDLQSAHNSVKYLKNKK